MTRSRLIAAALATMMLGPSASAMAQQGTQGAAENVPEQMPFNTPYGPPITLARAEGAIQAAMAEARKHGWALNVAVVDSGAALVAFARMDNAQLASVRIAAHKARVAATFRRPTRVFEDAVQKHGQTYVLTLDGVIASRGGIPLVENGHIIGAIGCSGGTGAQDEVACTAGAATVNGTPTAAQ